MVKLSRVICFFLFYALLSTVEVINAKHGSATEYRICGTAYIEGLIVSGRYEQFGENEIKRLEEHYGENCPQSAQIWDNLGQNYISKKDLEKARECFKRAINVTVDAVEHANRVTRFIDFLKQNRFEEEMISNYVAEACQWYKKAIELANNSPERNNRINRLIEFLKQNQREIEAIPYYEQRITELREKGEHATYICEISRQIAQLYRLSNQNLKAEPYLLEVASFTNRISDLSELVDCQLALQRDNAAADSLRKYIEQHTQKNASNIQLWPLRLCLAHICERQGKLSEAEGLYERNLNDAYACNQFSIDGKDVSETVQVYSLFLKKLGNGSWQPVLKKNQYQDQLVESQRITALLRKAAKHKSDTMFKFALDESYNMHKIHADALSGYGSYLNSAHRFDDAIRVLLQAKEEYERTVGTRSYESECVMVELGNVYRAQKLLGNAEEVYRAAIEVRKQRTWPNCPAQIALLFAIADCSEQQLKYQETDALLKQAFRIATHAQAVDSNYMKDVIAVRRFFDWARKHPRPAEKFTDSN